MKIDYGSFSIKLHPKNKQDPKHIKLNLLAWLKACIGSYTKLLIQLYVNEHLSCIELLQNSFMTSKMFLTK